jgi:hypothetical protein
MLHVLPGVSPLAQVLVVVKSGPLTVRLPKVMLLLPTSVATMVIAWLAVSVACGPKVREVVDNEIPDTVVAELVKLMKLATDGTPLLFTRNSM